MGLHFSADSLVVADGAWPHKGANVMPSWRDTASVQAQQDLDDLLGAALGFAQRQLASHGEFYPYAIAIRTDGETEMIPGLRADADRRPSSAHVLAACLSVLSNRQAEIRAAAIVVDVHLPDLDQDAIEVSLEHAEGQALRVLLPYARHGDIEYGPIRASDTDRRIWAHN